MATASMTTTAQEQAPSSTAQEHAATGHDSSQATSGSFEDLNIPADVMAGLKSLGYTAPTPVQRQAYIHAVAGRDLVVQSKTGSGKTTAFCLPTAVRLKAGMDRPQGLVLCPTRELAFQVAEEAKKLMAPKGLEVVAIYGGASFGPQVEALKRGAALVVGTPGRIQDQIERGNFKLDGVQTVVLDEADEMLSMGFWEDVTRILRMLPSTRQTFLFSATLPDAIERAARTFLKDPVRLAISGDTYSVEGVENLYYAWNDTIPKPRAFLWIMEVEKPRSAIVFANTRGESEMLCHYLRRFGINADVLNGDLAQKDRERVMRLVKSGALTVMVATDIASRGIDISDLSHVFNYDLPEDPEVYIHRVGRTGRIGKKGTAVSLVRGRFEATLEQLKKKFNVPMQLKTLPPESEIIQMQAQRLTAQLKEEASGVEFSQYLPVAAHLLSGPDAPELLAFLLRSYYAARKPKGLAVDGVEVASGPPLSEDKVPAAGGKPHHRGERDHQAPRPERPARESRPAPVAARTERSVNPEHAVRPQRAAEAADGPPTALFIGVGEKEHVTEAAVREFVVAHGGVTAADVGRVAVKHDFCVVDVPPALVAQMVTALNGKPLGGVNARVEPKLKRAGDSHGRRRRRPGQDRPAGAGSGSTGTP